MGYDAIPYPRRFCSPPSPSPGLEDEKYTNVVLPGHDPMLTYQQLCPLLECRDKCGGAWSCIKVMGSRSEKKEVSRRFPYS